MPPGARARVRWQFSTRLSNIKVTIKTVKRLNCLMHKRVILMSPRSLFCALANWLIGDRNRFAAVDTVVACSDVAGEHAVLSAFLGWSSRLVMGAGIVLWVLWGRLSTGNWGRCWIRWLRKIGFGFQNVWLLGYRWQMMNFTSCIALYFVQLQLNCWQSIIQVSKSNSSRTFVLGLWIYAFLIKFWIRIVSTKL